MFVYIHVTITVQKYIVFTHSIIIKDIGFGIDY